MAITLPTPELAKLDAILTSLGDCVPLGMKFDLAKLYKELATHEKDWRIYNPGKPGYKREGLSLTSLDGGLSGIPDLDSLTSYNEAHDSKYSEMSFQTPTAAYQTCESIHPLFEAFGGYVGRSHFLKLGAGGFFPPHRDLDFSCFRIFMPCFRANKFCFSFVLDDQILPMREGIAYFVNVRKAHSIFSFSPDSIHLVMNIKLDEHSVRAVLNQLIER